MKSTDEPGARDRTGYQAARAIEMQHLLHASSEAPVHAAVGPESPRIYGPISGPDIRTTVLIASRRPGRRAISRIIRRTFRRFLADTLAQQTAWNEGVASRLEELESRLRALEASGGTRTASVDDTR